MKRAAVIVSILLVGALLFGCASTSNQNYTLNYTLNYTQNYTNYTQNYTSNYTQNYTNNTSLETYKGGPIYIKGDDEFTAANGVVSGSGTFTDPYIIEGWTIDASSSNPSIEPYTNYGIYLFQTSKYFVIRDCRVENATGYSSGISLSFVSNGKIENCTFANDYTGIEMEGTSNITLSDNTIENCDGDGISNAGAGYSSDNVTISDNLITGCKGDGISFHYLFNSYAINNTVRNGEGNTGILVTDSINSTISNNIVQGNKYDGIDISASMWEWGDHNIISNNDVSGNGDMGLSVGGSYDTITYNTANENGRGISLGTVDSVFSNNTANNNKEIGFNVDTNCVNNTISYNTFVSNNEAKEFYNDGTPYWVDMYFDHPSDTKNVFKDNTYGTTNPH